MRWTCLLLVGLLAPVRAQETGEVLGLVRTESGRPVAGARVRFVPDRSRGFAWRLPPDAPAPAVIGRSRSDGRFRFDAPTGSGTLVVEHESGLGAVVHHVATGAAVPVVVRALGSVRRADGRPFAAQVRLLLDDGSVWLDPLQGTELRLPAGRWLLLVDTGGSRQEVSAAVRPGTEVEIAPTSTAGHLVAAPDAARIELGRWPGLEARDAAGRLPALGGPDVLAAVAEPEPGLEVHAQGWVEPRGVVRLPVVEGEVRRFSIVGPAGEPVAHAEVLTLLAGPGPARIVAHARVTGGAGRVWAPADLAADESVRPVVVVLAPGLRPGLVELDELPDTMRLAAAHPMRFRLEGASGQMVAGASVVCRSPQDPLLDRRVVSDDRGVVHVPDAAGESLTVVVHSAEHLPREVVLPTAETGVPLVTLVPGREVKGVVRMVPDRLGDTIEVQLRDTAGTFGVPPRTVVADADGAFRFGGLPDGIYTLFAQTTVDGVTWSGILRGVQPGRDEWTLQLRSEDPAPPGARRDR